VKSHPCRTVSHSVLLVIATATATSIASVAATVTDSTLWRIGHLNSFLWHELFHKRIASPSNPLPLLLREAPMLTRPSLLPPLADTPHSSHLPPTQNSRHFTRPQQDSPRTLRPRRTCWRSSHSLSSKQTCSMTTRLVSMI
jgi:hypothetical protein